MNNEQWSHSMLIFKKAFIRIRGTFATYAHEAVNAILILHMFYVKVPQQYDHSRIL